LPHTSSKQTTSAICDQPPDYLGGLTSKQQTTWSGSSKECQARAAVIAHVQGVRFTTACATWAAHQIRSPSRPERCNRLLDGRKFDVSGVQPDFTSLLTLIPSTHEPPSPPHAP